MKRITLCLLLVLQVCCLKAQYNLVTNPSFEVFDTCPSFGNLGKIEWAVPWTNPLRNTTPDYFNACDSTGIIIYGVPANYIGYEPAHTGVAYADISTYNNVGNPVAHKYREYIQTELTDSLTTGVDYCIRFYVSSCDSCHYTSNNIGVYFSPVQIMDTCPQGNACNLPYTPQFENPSTNDLSSRNGWTLVSGSFTATGGEKFIIIGNFRDTNSTVATYTGWGTYPYAAFYIDDVLLAPCDSLAGIEQYNFTLPKIKLFPSPTQQQLNIESADEIIKEIKVYTVFGNLIIDEIVNNKSRMVSVNVLKLREGVYLICIDTPKNRYNLKFIKN